MDSFKLQNESLQHMFKINDQKMETTSRLKSYQN